jgi:hypothetical protein
LAIGALLATGVAAPASAQSIQPLPGSVRSSPNSGSSQQALQQFVQQRVAELTSGDPVAVAAAREAMLNEITGGDPGFLSAYAAAMENRLRPALSSEDLLAKINAAVVVDRLARVAEGTELTSSVRTLIEDENPIVVRWGVTAAKGILPTALTDARAVGRDRLVPAIGDAVQNRFPDDAALAQYAYETLAEATNDLAQQDGAEQGVGHAADGLLRVMETRLRQYQQTLPESTRPEQEAIRVLGRAQVGEVLRQQGREQRVVQALSDLIALLSARRPEEDARPRAAEINQLIEFSALSLAAFTFKDEIVAEAQTVRSSMSTATGPQQVQTLVEQFLAPVQTAYPDLRQPGVLPQESTEAAVAE